ncbi:VOC family protein [Mobilicoccus sp.]|uniref:VOC family protein n=1 Tax=Mobilicoccus sp. TaxID=2034349 RepID=UPI00289A636A|nr:VOC family protein [Mobilicoccus sp.]
MRVVPGLSLTIDCRDPGLLVPFWCEALAYVPAPAPEGHATWRSFYLSIGESEESLGEGDACDRVIDPDGVRPSLWFQVVPEVKRVKNRVHLDVHVTEAGAPWATRHRELVARGDALVALGGVLREPISSSPDDHLVLKINDPEGNELCLV